MREIRVYSPFTPQEQTIIELSESAAAHIGRVLRMKPDQNLTVFNGEGISYQTTIIEVTKKHVSVKLEYDNTTNVESPLYTHLGQSLSRGERMDYAIQKATEMGISEITPLFSERCEVKLAGDRIKKRMAHWQQVIISACEQCGRSRLPIINPPQTLDNWVRQVQADQKLVLHHRTEQTLQAMSQPTSVAVLIGPEGGLSSNEIQLAEQQCFSPLALGPRVLRTETAPIAVLTLLQAQWGDF
ncbi:16S rRNA (uracil(1498)-N(3))-methyltransferase [Spartinivicinus poritis]|uniref:Ribosomal RNA small subunit methyltransferase E n=1 Tax=Spartinivicinus poritis TaxID=2994640 RepID=A0ABT5UGM4_9GAMM|nr:16S rRNA (uracil(1498)-N(3))-methyltransferase [Spartinivicinus sp. A2-2]MDE1464219.1 16S rRNA (uracil(1498)-N(3))-methyltransferase [Spartinivicinus sp. A2-2]